MCNVVHDVFNMPIFRGRPINHFIYAQSSVRVYARTLSIWFTSKYTISMVGCIDLPHRIRNDEIVALHIYTIQIHIFQCNSISVSIRKCTNKMIQAVKCMLSLGIIWSVHVSVCVDCNRVEA